MTNTEGKISAKTLIVWQVLACLCAFFACSFVTGLEGLFCSLAAGFAAALLCSGAGPLSLLSSGAGALLGYAFALWSENGGVSHLVLEAPWLADSVELTMDFRVLGLFWMLCLAGMIAVSALVIRKGYARTVCVAANTALLVLAELGGLVWIFRAKYGVLSWELLREKIHLLCKSVGDLLVQSFSQVGATEQMVDEAYLRSLADSLVYTVPLILLLGCGAFAFFHSFLLKRLLKKSGVLTPERPWMFFPSLASAMVCVGITVATFFLGDGSPASYGLQLLDGFLSWMFFVPGLTALRLLISTRRGGGRRFPLWVPVLALILFPVFLGVFADVVSIVGLVFVIVTEWKKIVSEKQNLK